MLKHLKDQKPEKSHIILKIVKKMAYFGWKCDDKVMYLPKHNQSTTCTMHRKCNIDITVNKTNVIFKDQCGCKTLHTETYIWPRRKVLHLILGAHTILGASHGAVWKNIKVYSGLSS